MQVLMAHGHRLTFEQIRGYPETRAAGEQLVC